MIKCLKVVIAYDLYKIIVNANMCAEFKLLKIKVPLIFSSMVGFPRPRDGH